MHSLQMLDPLLIACALFMAGAAAMHGYWALGGRRGLVNALPQHPGNRPVAVPGPGLTAVVAALLLVCAVLIGANTAVFACVLPPALLHGLTPLLACVFLVRALARSQHVGWFKRVRGTTFARRDDWLYCPICLVIGLSLLAASLRQA